jgi:hypothetical protein
MAQPRPRYGQSTKLTYNVSSLRTMEMMMAINYLYHQEYMARGRLTCTSCVHLLPSKVAMPTAKGIDVLLTTFSLKRCMHQEVS